MSKTWGRSDRVALSRALLAVAVVVVVVVAAGAVVILGQSKSTSTTTTTQSTSSSTTYSFSSSLSLSNSLGPPGSLVVVPANYNFTVSPHGCKYFNFTDDSFYANFTGAFNANPNITMYLLNITSYSLAQASGASIVQYTFATAGNFNVTLALSSFKWNVSIPKNPYYLGFCDWTNDPDSVATNSTAISIAWP